jgi:DNA-binding MarR family transcriptional regulator
MPARLSSRLLETIPFSINVIRKLSSEALGGALTIQQLRILKLVHEGFGASDMARLMDISVPAVSRMIDGLAKKDFIKKTVGDDKRTSVLSLTKKGRIVWDEVTKSVSRRLQQALQVLEPHEKETLDAAMDLLDTVMKKANEE